MQKVMKNVMNKMIVAMIMMAIANVMPAMADNHKNVNSGRRDHPVVVNNHNNKDVHAGKMDKKPAGHDAHNKHAYKPDVKSCVVKVSRHTHHNRVVARAERVRGVMDTRWNPRTRELIIRYDARMTSARNIRHAVA